MKSILFLAALVFCSLAALAQEEQRPGIQTPGFWLTPLTGSSPFAVGFECPPDVAASYTLVFPQTAPRPGQVLKVDAIDRIRRRCLLAWIDAMPQPAAQQPSRDVFRCNVAVAPIPQNSTAIVNVDVANAHLTDAVTVTPMQDLPDGLVVASARVVEGGKVQIRLVNTLAGAVDPQSIEWTIALDHAMLSKENQ